jgi:hypothetical protein
MDTPNEAEKVVSNEPMPIVAAPADPETTGATDSGPISEPSPVISAPIPASVRTCRHCSAEYPAYLSKCPGCGKDQRGAPKGPRNSAPKAQAQLAPVAPPKPPAFVPTEKQLAQLEDALAETVTFIAEDIAAPLVLRGRKAVPPFGESRATKIGAAWAPILAPYMSGPILLMLLAIAVTARGIGGYLQELKAPAKPEQKELPLVPHAP